MQKRPKNLDLNQLAKRIVDEAVEQSPAEKNQVTAAKGRLGGLKGGAARAEKLTPEQRSEIAKIAAQTRWKKSD